ncbi:MAG: hypothetical protein ACXWT4_06115 [Methylobacter sp.]
MLELNPTHAKAIDTMNSAIKESGKYVGTITRAEKLTSRNGTPGLGLSFRSDAGESADYLDVYLGETDGRPWPGSQVASALLCCLKLRKASDGQVKVEKFNSETRQRETVIVSGYPELQGKRIGFLLQKELSDYQGKTRERMAIVGVFQADTELTASEILEGKTTPEHLPKLVQALMARPVRDTRKNPASQQEGNASAPNYDDFDDMIPF